MILIDTSVWADHFRRPDAALSGLVERRKALMHPFVLGELAMGRLGDWDRTVASLRALPSIGIAPEREWLAQVRRHDWPGTGIGFVDAHLLAAVGLTLGAKLWTRDKRLAAQAEAMDVHWQPD